MRLLFSDNKWRDEKRQRSFTRLVVKSSPDRTRLNVLSAENRRWVGVVLSIRRDDKAVAVLGQETKVKRGNPVVGV